MKSHCRGLEGAGERLPVTPTVWGWGRPGTGAPLGAPPESRQARGAVAEGLQPQGQNLR